MAAKQIYQRNAEFRFDSDNESELDMRHSPVSDEESFSSLEQIRNFEYSLADEDENGSTNEDDNDPGEEDIHIEGDRYELQCLNQTLQAEIRKYPESRIRSVTGNINEEPFQESRLDVEDELTEILEQLPVEREQESCSHCSEKIPVNSPTMLEKGQHISVAGQKALSYIKPLRKQLKLYSHHAIVKQVVSVTGNKVKIRLIHFYERDSKGNITLSETEETFDLQNDEMNIIKYEHPRYTPDKIVQRAESALEVGAEVNKTYGLLMNNCEHFATWCVVGTSDSFQVGGLRSKFVDVLKTLCGVGSKIANYILRLRIMRFLYLASDEMATGLSTAAGHITLGVTAAAYLIYCIVMTVYFLYRYRKREICRKCFKHRLIDLWLQFSVFGVTSTITYIFVHFLLPFMPLGLGIPVLVLLLALSTLLIWLVPKIRKKLQSPLHAEGTQIANLSELQEGDIVSFSYYSLKHYLIVTEVHTDPNSETQGDLKCVHYSLPNLVAKRIIAEDYFSVDLTKKTIKKYDCGPLNIFPRNEIVRRARSRIGETNWSMTNNRSDHLCHWAVTDQSQHENNTTSEAEDEIPLGESKSKVKSSSFMSKKMIHLMDEINVGDAVECKGNKGIVIGLTDQRDGRKFELEMALLQKGRIRVNKETIDLNIDTVTVHLYQPAHCYPMQERVDRALAVRDKSSYCWTQTGFVEECMLIPHVYRKKPVHDLSKLCGGEIIVSSAISHFSIVTEVALENEAYTMKGNLRCVNYSASSGTRIVAEDWYKIDLNKDKLTVLEFGQVSTFPRQEVVRRVRRRIGETKWNRNNRSETLCFWAVRDERRDESTENTEPKSTEESEVCASLRTLEMREVHLSEELLPGDVIYLYGKSSSCNKGILVELNDIREGREFEMAIVMLKDRPRLDRVMVDLNKEKVFVRLYDPSGCCPMIERVRRANDFRDKRSERWTKLGFIADCIKKGNQDR